MCGYACIGCGKCGKPRTLKVGLTCLKCGEENTPDSPECRACGYQFAPKPGGAKTSKGANYVG